MNRDIIEGNWKMVKGKIKAKWGRLTDDEIDQVEGNYEQLCGTVQKAYGLSREQVEKEISKMN